jgi:uncharacterized glyoxalase superfamily protein PhnB
MPRSTKRPPAVRSPTAVGLRVADVQRAAEFYQAIGFGFVMAVPDESERWLLCLLRYGRCSILLGPLDHLQFPRSHRHRWLRGGPRGLGVRIDLTVADIGATYGTCRAAGCEIIEEPAEEISGDRAFSCLDPFGYEWRFTQLSERRPFDLLGEPVRATWS